MRLGDAFLALAIAAVGVAEIYSATQYELSETYYVKQIYYILLGLVVLALVVSLDYRLLSQQVPYIYLVAILSLLLVLLVAPFIHGTRGWIPLGAFKIQPAEFAKVAIVLTLARFLSENRTPLSHLRRNRQGLSSGGTAPGTDSAATRPGFGHHPGSAAGGRSRARGTPPQVDPGRRCPGDLD